MNTRLNAYFNHKSHNVIAITTFPKVFTFLTNNQCKKSSPLFLVALGVIGTSFALTTEVKQEAGYGHPLIDHKI